MLTRIQIRHSDSPLYKAGQIFEACVFNKANEAMFIVNDEIQHITCGDFVILPTLDESIQKLKPSRVIMEFNRDDN